MTRQVTDRLDRLEGKVDRMVEILSTVARVEERQAQQRETVGRVWTAIEAFEARINELEKRQTGHSWAIRYGERIFWAVITTGLAALLWHYRAGG